MAVGDDLVLESLGILKLPFSMNNLGIGCAVCCSRRLIHAACLYRIGKRVDTYAARGERSRVGLNPHSVLGRTENFT